MSDTPRIVILAITLALIGGSIFYLEKGKVIPASSVTSKDAQIAVAQDDQSEEVPSTSLEATSTGINEVVTASGSKKIILTILPQARKVAGAEKIKKDALYKKAIEIQNPSGFLNTDGKAITIGGLLGKKVILVDFWTYSCINCQRTLPYVNAWYDKYKEKGLEIVSIHTPEFEFEKDKANVQKAAEKFGVKYPIVQDNDYGTWQAYGNRYWPRKYLIDIDGYIVYDHIGEGAYDESEKKIQEALKEREERLGMANTIENSIVKPTNAITIGDVGSPETYFGSKRNEYLGNGIPGEMGEKIFSAQNIPKENTLYLDGKWNITEESAKNLGTAKIVYKFSAQNVYLVAASSNDVVVTILLDGKPIGLSGGVDVKGGKLLINDHRLYHLVGLPISGTHTLEIQIPDSGVVETFAFTFG